MFPALASLYLPAGRLIESDFDTPTPPQSVSTLASRCYSLLSVLLEHPPHERCDLGMHRWLPSSSTGLLSRPSAPVRSTRPYTIRSNARRSRTHFGAMGIG